MNQIENYIKEKRIYISNTIEPCKKIYLDTNYWLKLRDASKIENSIYKKILDKLNELIELNKCIIPISEITFWEILKQSDFQTLKESAMLIDKFSKGISIVNEEDRRRTEFISFLRKIQGKDCYETKELVWTKLSMNVLYDVIPSPDNIELKTKYIDFLYNISFIDIVSLAEKNKSYKAFTFKDNIDFFNAAKEKYKNENKTLEQMILSEFGGYIDLFKESLNECMAQIYYWDSGQYPDKKEIQVNHDGLKNCIYNLFKLKKITTELPSYSIFPELNASIRWNKDRKYKDGNDTIDFLHATAALPYFDFFFTEDELKTMISQRKLDNRYNCIVESNPNKTLEILNTI